MNLQIIRQEKYSRVELLLRAFFGAVYIGIPHGFLLMFIHIGVAFVVFLNFWAILFTGKFPRSFFDFMLKYMKWGYRVAASKSNLCDGYPPFGLNTEWKPLTLEITYPEQSSRWGLLLRLFFGIFYICIPHAFCLGFRFVAQTVIDFIAFWAILFTGEYPKEMHAFSVGTYRWMIRVSAYYTMMLDDYPPFSGKE